MNKGLERLRMCGYCICCHESLSLSSKRLDMNIFQESCCSILGVLLVFLLQGLIREVKIEDNYVWLQSENICMFHLRCVASGDPSPSYSWISPQTQGPQLNINLSLAESATLNCTGNNTVSVKYTTKTVVCTDKSEVQQFCVKS
ncbi:hypothetical protein cypCar_00046366 [Cyprinus carpio]|nr:hypothetical protein cypCar_00046366 [Cyprinus carpio]